MYDYNLVEERDVLCIDQKVFASVSCIQKGLDPMKEKLAVVADTKRQGSVVLAATGPLKALGVKRDLDYLKYHIEMTYILLIQV